jgi:hypothetical protein
LPAHLPPAERKSLRDFSRSERIEQPPLKPLSLIDFLRSISSLPASVKPTKPATFKGNNWKL